MTDAPASELGRPPEQFEFGCTEADGRVVIRFSHLVSWFDMEPSLAIRFAEGIINCALKARPEPAVVRATHLPGVPYN